MKRLETLKESRDIKASVQQEVRGTNGNQTENTAVDIVYLENKIRRLEKEHSVKQAELYKIFNCVKDPDLKYLLIYRYVDCMDWINIAGKLNYSYSYITGVLKNKAVSEVIK